MDLPAASAKRITDSGCRIPAILLLCLLFLPASLAQAARQVSLAWDPNQESALGGYRVFCRPAGGVYTYSQPAWDGAATTCTIANLDEYTAYAFVVRAYDTSGNQSADSEEVWLDALPLPSLPEPDPEPPAVPPAPPQATAPESGAEEVFLTPVLQTAPFATDDASDQHLESRWVITRTADGLCVLDVTSTVYLTELDVPPLVLEADTEYSWTVRYAGTRGTLSDWSTPATFITGDSGLDADGDGIPDDQAVDPGIDLDGNAVDDADQADLRCVNVPDGSGQLAICAPEGSGVTGISAMESTDLASIGSPSRIPYEMPLGMVSFRLTLAQVGGIARVQVHFSQAASPAARWVKYDSIGGWQDYSAHAVFAADRLSVELEIEDGGFGDADGVANGIVIDPSGFGVATGNSVSDDGDARTLSDTAATASSGGGGGGGGCFIGLLWP